MELDAAVDVRACPQVQMVLLTSSTESTDDKYHRSYVGTVPEWLDTGSYVKGVNQVVYLDTF